MEIAKKLIKNEQEYILKVLKKRNIQYEKKDNEKNKVAKINHGSLIDKLERKCKCQIPAVSRIVAKEGPNKGKEFFVCSKGDSKGKCR
jgi:hypothetical protein